MDSIIRLMESEDDIMSFLSFCQEIATPTNISITSNEQVPDEFREPFDALVSQMKNKMNRLDRIEVVFVQNKFNNMNKVDDIMQNEYSGEVDDNLAAALSRALYNADFNNLVSEEQSIIKILTVYLMILKHFNYND